MSAIIVPLVVGDTVALKSGGDFMTVERVEGDSVICVWFQMALKELDSDENDRGTWEGPYRNTFPMAVLRKVELTHADDEDA